MDFDLSPRVTELRDRVRAFMDEHVYPHEAEALRALDAEVTVDSDRAYPEILVEIRERARSRASGTCSCRKQRLRLLPGSVSDR